MQNIPKFNFNVSSALIQWAGTMFGATKKKCFFFCCFDEVMHTTTINDDSDDGDDGDDKLTMYHKY